MDDNSEAFDQILNIINLHTGKENSITQNELLVRLHQASYKLRYDIPNTRTLLRIIHEMRRIGYVIASSSEGYFKPVDMDEAKTYLSTVMESRAKDLLQTIRAQRRAIYREYSGQIHMEE